jgi:trigger factor
MQIHYQAEPAKVKEKRQEAIVQFRKIQIPGFRKGKAPDQAIEIKLKKQIDDYVKHEMTVEAYNDIIYESKIKPIGHPQITKMDLHDSNFSCDLMVLKKPDVELKQYRDFSIPKPHQQYSVAEMVEKMLQELRVKFADVSPYGENDFVTIGDKVTLDCICLTDSSLSKEGILYVVGDKLFPEFDDNILGMSAGEERTFSVKNVDGAVIDCKVLIHMGMRNTPAALDDSLAQRAGFESYAKMREAANGIATGRAQEQENQAISQQVVKRLLAEHEFEIPSWLIAVEAKQLAMQSGADFSKLPDENKNYFIAAAKSNVKLTLILDEIKDKEPETVFTDMELMDIIKHRVAAMGQDPEKFIVESRKDGRLISLLAALRSEAVLEWIVKNSKVVE